MIGKIITNQVQISVSRVQLHNKLGIEAQGGQHLVPLINRAH